MRKQTVQELILAEEVRQFREAEQWIAQHPDIYLCKRVGLYYCKHPELIESDAAVFLHDFMKNRLCVKNTSDNPKCHPTRNQAIAAELEALGERIEDYKDFVTWLEEILENYKFFILERLG